MGDVYSEDWSGKSTNNSEYVRRRIHTNPVEGTVGHRFSNRCASTADSDIGIETGPTTVLHLFKIGKIWRTRIYQINYKYTFNTR